MSPTGHPTQPWLGCASNWFELRLFRVKGTSLPDVDSHYESGGVLRTSLDQTQLTSLLKLGPIDHCVTLFFLFSSHADYVTEWCHRFDGAKIATIMNRAFVNCRHESGYCPKHFVFVCVFYLFLPVKVFAEKRSSLESHMRVCQLGFLPCFFLSLLLLFSSTLFFSSCLFSFFREPCLLVEFFSPCFFFRLHVLFLSRIRQHVPLHLLPEDSSARADRPTRGRPQDS